MTTMMFSPVCISQYAKGSVLYISSLLQMNTCSLILESKTDYNRKPVLCFTKVTFWVAQIHAWLSKEVVGKKYESGSYRPKHLQNYFIRKLDLLSCKKRK